MPTYLTPGVYVEEIPSAKKPIEGVGTSIAAFVGLLPGGPVNTPMRISNWAQFAKIFGDPESPANRPFMAGAYPPNTAPSWTAPPSGPSCTGFSKTGAWLSGAWRLAPAAGGGRPGGGWPGGP